MEGKAVLRYLMWFTLGFALACAWGICGMAQYWWSLAAVVILLTGSAFVCFRHIRKWLAPAIVGLGICAGLFWCGAQNVLYLQNTWPADGEMAVVTARVSDYPEETRFGCRVACKTKLNHGTYQVVLYLKERKVLSPGDYLTGRFQLQATAGENEFSDYLAGKGIFLQGFQRDEKLEIIPGKPSLREFPAVLRHGIKKVISKCLDGEAADFATALLLGDGTGLDYETNTALKITGIRHVVAVSGLHVSILFSVICLLLGSRPKLVFWGGIPLLIIFAGTAGFTPSVVRACVMLGILQLAIVLNREYDAPSALSAACLGILLWNPLAIASVSFQLSFSCVAGILLFSGKINRKLLSFLNPEKKRGFWGSIARWFSMSVSVTLGASVLTLPLAAVYFHTVSLVGVAANLILLPAITLLFHGLTVMILLGVVWLPLGKGLGFLISRGIDGVIALAGGISQFPLAAVYTRSPYIVIWLIFIYGLLLIYLLTGRKRTRVFSAICALGLCLSLALSWVEPLMHECWMTVLDIGQGQCVILHARDKTFLIDCGGDYDDVASDLAAETLLSRGISRLDGLVVTHYDRDHVGGVSGLLSRVRTDRLYVPRKSEEYLTDFPLEIVSDPVIMESGGMKLTVFPPALNNQSNDESLVVLFQSENCAILITGDRSDFGERMLLKRYALPDVDILIAGHHGSASSTCQELLDAVTPETVVISAGRGNRYGHPADETLERLEKFGCEIYRTDLQGTIEFVR